MHATLPLGTIYTVSHPLLYSLLIFYLLMNPNTFRLDDSLVVEVTGQSHAACAYLTHCRIYSTLFIQFISPSVRWRQPARTRAGESLAVTSRKLDKLALHLFRSIPPSVISVPPRARRTGAARRFLAPRAWQDPRKIVARP